jgi:hypothetical protein
MLMDVENPLPLRLSYKNLSLAPHNSLQTGSVVSIAE